MKHRFKPNPRGTMLHDAVIATVMSSMLVLLSIRLLHQTMTLGADARSKIAFRQTCDRLASVFRDDVRNAKSFSVENGALRLLLPTMDSISYRFSDRERPVLLRTCADASGETKNDVFHLTMQSQVSISPTNAGEAVELEIHSLIPKSTQLKRHELRVVASINRTSAVASSLDSQAVTERKKQ